MAREMFEGMIREDHSSIANLPREVVYKEYPKCDYIEDGALEDTIRGLDDDNRNSIGQVNRNRSKSKY